MAITTCRNPNWIPASGSFVNVLPINTIVCSGTINSMVSMPRNDELPKPKSLEELDLPDLSKPDPVSVIRAELCKIFQLHQIEEWLDRPEAQFGYLTPRKMLESQDEEMINKIAEFIGKV